MISLTFFSDGARLTGFKCEGHSGLAEAGSDILCAAVTGAVRLAETAINDVLGTGASVKVNEAAARIELTLPPSSSQEQDDAAQAVLTGLMLLGIQLKEEYPYNIDVTAP